MTEELTLGKMEAEYESKYLSLSRLQQRVGSFSSIQKGWFQFAIIPCAFLFFLLKHNEKRAGSHSN